MRCSPSARSRRRADAPALRAAEHVRDEREHRGVGGIDQVAAAHHLEPGAGDRPRQRLRGLAQLGEESSAATSSTG